MPRSPPKSNRKTTSPRLSRCWIVAEAAEKKSNFYVGVCADPARALRLAAYARAPRAPRRRHGIQASRTIGSWRCTFSAIWASTLRGPIDDTSLLSYALNPTHSTQSLADVAARNNQPPPSSLPSAAAAIHALVPALREEAEKAGVSRVYAEIDLPLAPVLYRMEKAGVRIDTDVLGRLSTRFAAS